MKINHQFSMLHLSALMIIGAAVLSTFLALISSQTVLAYKCTGSGMPAHEIYPEDFYALRGGEDVSDYKLDNTTNTEEPREFILKNATSGEYWDENSKSCMINSYDYPGKDPDQFGNCNSGAKKIDGKCYEARNYATFTTPVRNDGTPITDDEFTCADEGDNGYYAKFNRCVENNCPGFDRCDGTGKTEGYGCADGQSCDTTKRPFIDFPNSQDCSAAGGKFVITKQGLPGASNDTWTCIAPDDIGKIKNPGQCKDNGGFWLAPVDSGDEWTCYKPNGNTELCKKAGTETYYLPSTRPNGQCDPGDESTKPGAWQDPNPPANNGQPGQPSTPTIDPNDDTAAANCNRARLVLIPVDAVGGGCGNTGEGAIGALLKTILKILTVGVGIVAVGSIVYAAMLYSSARDNAGQTQQAITIIRNTAIGLLLYIFMAALLQFLVPGGVL